MSNAKLYEVRIGPLVMQTFAASRAEAKRDARADYIRRYGGLRVPTALVTELRTPA